MNAKLNQQLKHNGFQSPILQPDADEDIEPRLSQTNLTRRLSTSTAELRCPNCSSIIYSRRHKLCGVCAEPLPPEYLFSSEEAQRLENILRLEKKRHRDWMTKASRETIAVPYLQA